VSLLLLLPDPEPRGDFGDIIVETLTCCTAASTAAADHGIVSLLLLQILNPAETFGDIIVDYSYVECTSACITALSAFDRLYPGSRWALCCTAMQCQPIQ
jgi:hypothetical protein